MRMGVRKVANKVAAVAKPQRSLVQRPKKSMGAMRKAATGSSTGYSPAPKRQANLLAAGGPPLGGMPPAPGMAPPPLPPPAPGGMPPQEMGGMPPGAEMGGMPPPMGAPGAGPQAPGTPNMWSKMKAQEDQMNSQA